MVSNDKTELNKKKLNYLFLIFVCFFSYLNNYYIKHYRLIEHHLWRRPDNGTLCTHVGISINRENAKTNKKRKGKAKKRKKKKNLIRKIDREE